jgi:hypothetical protein
LLELAHDPVRPVSKSKWRLLMAGFSPSLPDGAAAEKLTETADVLVPARGIARGVIGGAILWAVVGLAVQLVNA